MHPNLMAVAPLIGTWTGEGRGEYPTIDDFQYREEVSFSDVGKPFLHYVQLTWTPDDSAPMHTESGYLRVQPDGHIEMTIAHPMGQTELVEGELVAEDGVLTLTFDHSTIHNSSTAKMVYETKRIYHLSGDQLATSFYMASVGEDLTRHLTSTLKRVAPKR